MNKNEIQAILTLLEDPDNQIYDYISRSLSEKGEDIIPDLERAWEDTDSSLTQNRLENIIHKIQQNLVHQNLSDWVKDGAKDLIKGSYVVSKYQYPDIQLEDVVIPVEKIVMDIRKLITDQMSALEKIKMINYVIYDLYLFSGNSTNYYSPQNSYINQVLITKKGNAISLGVLYASVAQSLGLPVYGVSLPKNFILGYKDEFFELISPGKSSEGILFYINPFNKGAILGKNEINHFLQQQNITPVDSYYSICSNLEIIQRLLLNLIYSYEKQENNEKINDLKVLLKISRLIH